MRIPRLIYPLCLAITSCSPADTNLLPIDIGKTPPERLLAYYFGGFVSEESADPFAAGLLVPWKEGGYAVDLQQLTARLPADEPLPTDENRNGRLDWEEVEPVLQRTYYRVRPVPATLEILMRDVPYHDSTGWLKMEVEGGGMTAARRHLYMPESAIRQALAGYEASGQRLMYPAGTTVIGEHWLADKHVETTAMRKRADGFWDFMVFDAAGRLAPHTTTRPRDLIVPTRCVGCHFGDKRFEPEQSFPGPAPDGPFGTRRLHTPGPNDPEVVTFFDEHTRRSDTLLGLYASVYLARLRTASPASSLRELLRMSLEVDK